MPEKKYDTDPTTTGLNRSGFLELPKTGFLRLKQIIGPGRPIPVSKSTWWAGVRDGRYPAPVHLSRRVTAWRVEDIRSLIESAR
jgi:prophage regulatory protein